MTTTDLTRPPPAALPDREPANLPALPPLPASAPRLARSLHWALIALRDLAQGPPGRPRRPV